MLVVSRHFFVSQIYFLFLFFPKKYFLFFVERQDTGQPSQGTENKCNEYDTMKNILIHQNEDYRELQRNDIFLLSFLPFLHTGSFPFIHKQDGHDGMYDSIFLFFFLSLSSFIYSSFSHILSHSLCVRLCDWEADEYYSSYQEKWFNNRNRIRFFLESSLLTNDVLFFSFVQYISVWHIRERNNKSQQIG